MVSLVIRPPSGTSVSIYPAAEGLGTRDTREMVHCEALQVPIHDWVLRAVLLSKKRSIRVARLCLALPIIEISSDEGLDLGYCLALVY